MLESGAALASILNRVSVFYVTSSAGESRREMMKSGVLNIALCFSVTVRLKSWTIKDEDNSIINPRRACAARVTVLDRLSVCLSVTTFSATTRNETKKERYQQIHRYTGFILKKTIFV